MLRTMFLLDVLYLVFLAILPSMHVSQMMIILFMGGFMFLQYFYSDKIILSSLGAKIVTESEEIELHQIVSRLCANANLPMPKVAVVKTSMLNAFATGRNQKNAVVAVTTCLKELFDILIFTFSRYREFGADRGAAILTGQLSHLISALKKISGSGVPTEDLRKVGGQVSALFITPELSGSSFTRLFSTHPTGSENSCSAENRDGTRGLKWIFLDPILGKTCLPEVRTADPQRLHRCRHPRNKLRLQSG